MAAENKTIGAQLRQGREAMGWTLEEAAKRTKLKREALEKLEKDHFDHFPSLAYARGFVRIYARELGLNGWDLLQGFEGGHAAAVESYDLRPEDLEALPERHALPSTSSQSAGLILLFALLGLGLVIAGIKVYQIWPRGGTERPAATAAAGSSPAAQADTAVPVAQPAAPRAQAVAPAVGENATTAPASGVPAPRAEPMVPKAIPVASGSAVLPPQTAVMPPPGAVPAEEPPAPAAEPVTPETAAAAMAPAAVQQHTLQLRADSQAREDQLWVEVKAVRGNETPTLYRDLLPRGQLVPAQVPWNAERFIVRFRDAAAVDIIFDGHNAGRYDRPGLQTVVMPPP